MIDGAVRRAIVRQETELHFAQATIQLTALWRGTIDRSNIRNALMSCRRNSALRLQGLIIGKRARGITQHEISVMVLQGMFLCILSKGRVALSLTYQNQESAMRIQSTMRRSLSCRDASQARLSKENAACVSLVRYLLGRRERLFLRDTIIKEKEAAILVIHAMIQSKLAKNRVFESLHARIISSSVRIRSCLVSGASRRSGLKSLHEYHAQSAQDLAAYMNAVKVRKVISNRIEEDASRLNGLMRGIRERISIPLEISAEIEDAAVKLQAVGVGKRARAAFKIQLDEYLRLPVSFLQGAFRGHEIRMTLSMAFEEIDEVKEIFLTGGNRSREMHERWHQSTWGNKGRAHIYSMIICSAAKEGTASPTKKYARSGSRLRGGRGLRSDKRDRENRSPVGSGLSFEAGRPLSILEVKDEVDRAMIEHGIPGEGALNPNPNPNPNPNTRRKISQIRGVCDSLDKNEGLRVLESYVQVEESFLLHLAACVNTKDGGTCGSQYTQ